MHFYGKSVTSTKIPIFEKNLPYLSHMRLYFLISVNQ